MCDIHMSLMNMEEQADMVLSQEDILGKSTIIQVCGEIDLEHLVTLVQGEQW